MRSFGPSILRTAVLLLLIPLANTTSVTPITLSSFQQISGFSQACSKAYNTPLVQCTENDFAHGRACSMRCVQQLEEVSASINTKCKGTKAYPDTLIGMFFTKSGVSTLCPNVIDSGGAAGGGRSSQGATAKATSRTTHTVAQITQTRTSSTSQTTIQPVATSTVSSTSHTSASTSSTVASITSTAITSHSQAAQPTLNSGATLTQSRLTGFGSSTVQAASTSTSSAAKGSATAAQDKGGNRGGSGGTPFDISASTTNTVRTSWVVSSIICVLYSMWYI